MSGKIYELNRIEPFDRISQLENRYLIRVEYPFNNICFYALKCLVKIPIFW